MFHYSGYPPDPHYDHVSMYEEELAADGASGPETTITVDYSDDEEHTMDSESIDLNNKKRVKVHVICQLICQRTFTCKNIA